MRGRTRIIDLMAAKVRRDYHAGAAPSLFFHEGRFVAELRAALCLAGWPWPAAHRAAREVVDEALARARAERPAWDEAQGANLELSVARDAQCRQCGVALSTRQVHFCSRACSSSWWTAFNRSREAA